MLTRLAIGRRGLRNPSTIALFAAVLALYGGFVVLSTGKHYDGDQCRFADCGSRFYDQLPDGLRSRIECPPRPGDGFDGQFFLYLAHDPFAVEGVEAGLDFPRVRARRILSSWIAALVTGRGALGSPALALLVLQVVCGAAFVALAATRLVPSHASPAAGWTTIFGLAFSPFVLLSIDKLTTENLASLLLVLSILAARSERLRTGAAFAALAMLAKDVTILWPVAVIADALRRRDGRRASLFVLSFLPFALWYSSLLFRFPGPQGVSDATAFPLTGLVRAIAGAIATFPDKKALFVLLGAPAFVILSVLAIVRGSSRSAGAAGIFAVLSGVLLLSLDVPSWSYFLGFARQAHFLAIAVLALDSQTSKGGSRLLPLLWAWIGAVGVLFSGGKLLLA